ncbi:MAG: hypothetical protein M9922_07035 [Microthrixaceae bacterium]|nr:hypothetical protein [Microthrixaceae bacterium]
MATKVGMAVPAVTPRATHLAVMVAVAAPVAGLAQLRPAGMVAVVTTEVAGVKAAMQA